MEGSFTDTKRTVFTSEDIRFTRNGDSVYAIVMAWPDDGTVRIRTLGTNSVIHLQSIDSVELLGQDQALTWDLSGDALSVNLSGCTPTSSPLTLKIN